MKSKLKKEMSATKKRKSTDENQTSDKTIRVKLWFHHIKPGEKYGYDSPHFFMFPPKALEDWELKYLRIATAGSLETILIKPIEKYIAEGKEPGILLEKNERRKIKAFSYVAVASGLRPDITAGVSSMYGIKLKRDIIPWKERSIPEAEGIEFNINS